MKITALFKSLPSKIHSSKVVNDIKDPVRSLTNDILEKNEDHFTKVEKKLMNEVRTFKFEQQRIIDSEGNYVPELRFYGDEHTTTIDENVKKNLALMQKIENSTSIHNHPHEITLSIVDIASMIKCNEKKVIATTPGGGHSVMERITPLDKETKKQALKHLDSISNKFDKLNNHIKYDRTKNNLEKTEIINNFRVGQWKDFANKFGFKYTYKPGKMTKELAFNDISQPKFSEEYHVYRKFLSPIDSILLTMKPAMERMKELEVNTFLGNVCEKRLNKVITPKKFWEIENARNELIKNINK